MTRIGERVGLKVVYEAFADRAYTPEGRLVNRREPGAVITNPDQVADRAVRMAKEGKIIAIDGTVLDLELHTLCVHGDNPSAVELVKRIRQALELEGVAIRPMGPPGRRILPSSDPRLYGLRCLRAFRLRTRPPKSPFMKGGFRGISNILDQNPPCPPLRKGGIRLYAALLRKGRMKADAAHLPERR